jgi:phage/plasmid-associated DNA primase
MWQVKRKLAGKPVSNHLMIVFTGKQGAGKSTAIDILLKPLEDYRLDMAVPALADERNFHSLSRSFVVVCDEMHGCAKADIESLKHIVTARTVSARKLFTNSRDTLEQNASFIGSSNKAVDLLVRDDSGMRRFFSFDCAERMNWSQLNSVNAENMWKSIDEDREEGYLGGVFDELRVRQEEMRHRDSVESYLDETGALSGAMQKTISVRDVFSDYVEWCKDSAATPFDKTYFSKRMKALGVELRRTSEARLFVLRDRYVKSRDMKVFDLAASLPPSQ